MLGGITPARSKRMAGAQLTDNPLADAVAAAREITETARLSRSLHGVDHE